MEDVWVVLRARAVLFLLRARSCPARAPPLAAHLRRVLNPHTRSKNSFHIDPYHGAAAAELMADFFERTASEPAYWDKISDAALARISSRYRWEIYAQRLMTLANVFGCV